MKTSIATAILIAAAFNTPAFACDKQAKCSHKSTSPCAMHKSQHQGKMSTEQMQEKRAVMQEKMQKMRDAYQKTHPTFDREHFRAHMKEMHAKMQQRHDAMRAKMQQKRDAMQSEMAKHHSMPFQLPPRLPMPKAPARPQAPCQTAPSSVVMQDHDKDGVANTQDMCPSTPTGTQVDGIGCGLRENISLEGVHFKLSSDELKPESISILDRVVTNLKKRPDLTLEVAGHTDAQGDAQANLDLSQRRAEQVKAYLVDKGIAADNLVAKGYGESKLITQGTTKADHAKNRRVELNMLDAAQASSAPVVVPETTPESTTAPAEATPKAAPEETQVIPDTQATKEVLPGSPIPTEPVATDEAKVIEKAVQEITEPVANETNNAEEKLPFASARKDLPETKNEAVEGAIELDTSILSGQ